MLHVYVFSGFTTTTVGAFDNSDTVFSPDTQSVEKVSPSTSFTVLPSQWYTLYTIPTLSDYGTEHAILTLFLSFYPPLYFPFLSASQRTCGVFVFLTVVGWKWMFPAAAAFVSVTGSLTREGGLCCHLR